MIRLISQGHSYLHFKSMIPVASVVRNKHFSIQSVRFKSHYVALGLDSTASHKDIKSAYYKLSLQFHPDKNDGSEESIHKFREITEAYEVLGNPEKRKAYDERNQSSGSYHYDFRNTQRAGEYYRKPPQTGRTNYYNYDEHHKQHYEDYTKQREAENEYFRRRWEADRRYGYGGDWDEYVRRNYYRQQQPPRMRPAMLLRSKSFIYLMTFWLFMMVFSMFVHDKDTVRHKAANHNIVMGTTKLYYKVKNDETKED